MHPTEDLSRGVTARTATISGAAGSVPRRAPPGGPPGACAGTLDDGRARAGPRGGPHRRVPSNGHIPMWPRADQPPSAAVARAPLSALPERRGACPAGQRRWPGRGLGRGRAGHGCAHTRCSMARAVAPANYARVVPMFPCSHVVGTRHAHRNIGATTQARAPCRSARLAIGHTQPAAGKLLGRDRNIASGRRSTRSHGPFLRRRAPNMRTPPAWRPQGAPRRRSRDADAANMGSTAEYRRQASSPRQSPRDPGLRPPHVHRARAGRHAPPAAPWDPRSDADTAAAKREHRRPDRECPCFSARSSALISPRTPPAKSPCNTARPRPRAAL